MAGDAVRKPRLALKRGGWVVYDFDGRVWEWYYDFGLACKSARELWRYERKPVTGAEEIWRACRINDWRFFGDVS